MTLMRSPRRDPTGSALFDDVAGALASRVIDRERASALGRRLFERVRHSVESHRDFATVRREDQPWAEVAPGVRRRILRADPDLGVELWSLETGAQAPWPADTLALELLVVEGDLVLQAAAAVAQTVSPWGHRVLSRAAGVGLRGGAAGALLYVRRRRADLSVLAPNEAGWWAGAEAAPQASPAAAGPWTPFCAGAEIRALRVREDVGSLLVRLAAGTKLPDHDHRLDEDCFMLSGELFLGDILMRAGDFQRARAGGRHVDSQSDTGALLYFHGALPGGASAGPA